MSEETTKSRGRKVYRAKSFALSAMTCPGCHATMEAPADQCPRCGYSGHNAAARFPFQAPPMGRFIDPQEHLSQDDRSRIGKSLTELAKKFPQPRICFCIVDLAEEVDLREFGFWMMNASPVDSPEEAKLRPWTILLLVDDINGRVSIAPGYAIEPFLNEEAWKPLILRERQYFFARDYGTAALKFIQGAEDILMAGAAHVERKLQKKSTEGDSGKIRRKRKVRKI
jgi:hypothetical protein